MDDRLTLIDLSGTFWRHWHATGDQTVGEAFERTMRDVYDAANNGLVAVCCDSPPYWRREVLPEYKQHRAAAPPQAIEQLARAKAKLQRDGMLVWEARSFEADDVIAWATCMAMSDPTISDVRIVSADKDMLQLVCDRVTVFSPMANVAYQPGEVVEKFGVGPHLVGDYLALIGDSSDNVPGIPGVGPKTASSLLQAFGSLDAIIDAAKANDSRFTRPRIREAIVEHEANVLLSRRVIELRTDLPLQWEELRKERERVPESKVNDEALDAEHDDEGKTEPAPTLEKAAALTAIVPRQSEEWSLALEPRTSKAAWEISKALLESRLYKNFGTHEAVFTVIMRGRSLGMDATTALSAFHSIQGKLAMHADLIEALVLRSGKAEYFEFESSDNKQATYVTKRVGGKAEKRLTFTIDDALAAGLVTRDERGADGYLGVSESGKPSSWDKYRATMLRHRCKTQLARAVYPDVTLGLYDPEELEQ